MQQEDVMAMAKRFTFRKGPRPTGLGAIASPNADTSIKLEGMIVGKIYGPSRFGYDKWRVSLMVKKPATEDEPADFRWALLKAAFDTEAEARAWVQTNEDALRAKYELYQSEDDF